MDYAKQFVRYARQSLPDWQFAAIHHKAHSAAGGAAPRRGANDEDVELETIEEDSPATVVRKDSTARGEIHVDVPLREENVPRRKKKKRTRAAPPDAAEIVTKVLDDACGGSFTAALEGLDLGDAYAIACMALESVTKAAEPSVGAAVAHHRLAPVEQPEALFARICKRASGEGGTLPIFDASNAKQVLYCVGLEPDSYDIQNDSMDAEEIEKTAHKFLTEARMIGSMHTRPINAVPVESYIAPQDLVFDGGPFGKQVVRKGSWVLGIKVNDPAEWQKVLKGDYTGISVGGLGQRRNAEESA